MNADVAPERAAVFSPALILRLLYKMFLTVPMNPAIRFLFSQNVLHRIYESGDLFLILFGGLVLRIDET